MTAATLKLFRQTHLYIGVFIAPALLFFALTGALQTFSFHEGSHAPGYNPPAWIATLAQLHKNQTTKIGGKKPSGPPPSAQPAAESVQHLAPAPPKAPPPQITKWKQHLPMKIFFLLVTLGLFTSTLTGITMAYKYNSNKKVVTGLLIAGVVIPLLLLRF